jgi:hypothetical protein
LEWLAEGFAAFYRGFGMIFVTALVLWMAGLIFLLFRELFSSIQFVFKDYIQRVWKMLLICGEFTPYGFVIVGPILTFVTKNYLAYIMLTIDAILLSFLFYYLRKRLKGSSV